MSNTNLHVEETTTEIKEDLYMWLDEDLEEIQEDDSTWKDAFLDMLDDEEFDYDYESEYED